MRYNILFIILASMLVSCGADMEYTYKLTYTDGTEETVVTQNKLKSESNTDCVVTCGCGGSTEKFCGVRKFKLLKQREIGSDPTPTKSYKPDDF